MIETYLLEELVAVFKFQSLSKAAENLHLTQPTLSRGMQKLEQVLGVDLFERQANKILFTKTGLVAVKEAQKVLAANQQLVTTVRNFAQSQEQLTVAATIPGPLLLLKKINPVQVKVQAKLLSDQELVSKLVSHQFDLSFSNQELFTEDIESTYLGNEQLFVKLDSFHPLASKQAVTFAQLNSLSFLVANDIGIWKKIIQKEIPHAHFLYQQDLDSLSELTHYTKFPVFKTNLSNNNSELDEDDGRTLLLIKDSTARLDIYANYLKINQPKVKHLIKQIQAKWPK